MQQSTIAATGADSITVSTPSGYMRWLGAYLADVGPCDYQINIAARALPGQQSTNHGYAIGPRVTLDAGDIPHGHAFQYDVGFHGIRRPDYPNDYGDDAPGGIDPQQAFSDGSPVPVDGRWHRWVINVRGSRATATLDERPLLPIAFTSSCSSGLYLRVWNGAAQFRGITITKA